jgi:hypothetical protein
VNGRCVTRREARLRDSLFTSDSQLSAFGFVIAVQPWATSPGGARAPAFDCLGDPARSVEITTAWCSEEESEMNIIVDALMLGRNDTNLRWADEPSFWAKKATQPVHVDSLLEENGLCEHSTAIEHNWHVRQYIDGTVRNNDGSQLSTLQDSWGVTRKRLNPKKCVCCRNERAFYAPIINTLELEDGQT